MDIGDIRSKAGKRQEYLDGARGVAALTVVLAHCMSRMYVDPGSKAEIAMKAFLTLGHTSVLFFFVLSGFVLSIRFFGSGHVPYWRFQMGRVVRLYPCFFVTLLIAVAVRLIATDFTGYNESAGFAQSEQYPLTVIDFIRQATLIGITRGDINLNGPVWSMVYELRAGLFIPLFCWLLLRYSLKTSVLACGALIAFSSLGLWLLQMPNPPFTGEGSVLGSAFVTFHYLVAFYIGCITSRICRHEAVTSQRSIVILFAATALLLTGTAVHSDVLLSLGAACLIIGIRQSPALIALLTTPPVAFLGRISYPLYLVHFPMLLSILHATHGSIGQIPFIVVGVATSITVATLIYYFVEVPSIRWSRQVSR